MADAGLSNEINKRRTFAIISHPDAGKTTITEKVLLFGNAIQKAGTVKGRGSNQHAKSDWMEMEKERGISVTTSVMQFPYNYCLVNLLDTPGHEDFSEDTYRTLTAVDSCLMVIDAEVPTGSLFEWSLIDASTGTPLPGYQQMTDLMVDLGGIDWETTPSLRFKTHMITGQSGGPKIHSIGISGAINESFSENPAVHDWTLAGTSWTQSSGQVSGTGSVTSPIYRISNGFGALKTSIVATGAPILEANVDDKGWQSYPLEGYSTLDEIGTRPIPIPILWFFVLNRFLRR